MNTKVTIRAETPSEQIVKQAAQEHSVTDSRGRLIMLKRPNPLAQFKIVEIVGGDAAENRVYMSMVLPLIYVTSIDGMPTPPIQNKGQLEALIQRLDEDGITAVSRAVGERYGGIPSQSETRDQIKN